MEHGWFRSFEDFTNEHDTRSLSSQGDIPRELNGTLFRVGVGRYTAYGQRLPHWFDGEGSVLAIRLEGGKAKATARNVVSKGKRREDAKGRLFLGSYGIAPRSFWRRLQSIFDGRAYRNAANTNMLYWNHRLFALWEAGLPTELDPSTLRTLGERDLGGILRRGFSAHPHRVSSRQALINFGVRSVPSRFDLYELSDGGKTRRICSLPSKSGVWVHDFFVTPEHLVLICPPIDLDIVKAIWKGKSVAESLLWKPEEGTELLVYRWKDEKVFRLKVPAFIPLHFANAFEKDERLVIDLVKIENLDPFRDLDAMSTGSRGPYRDGFLCRAEIDLKQETLSWRGLSPQIFDLPQIRPQDVGKEYRHVYGCSINPEYGEMEYYDALSRIDVITGQEEQIGFGPNHYPSEPIFVPAQEGSEHGFLLSLVYDAAKNQSYLSIQDSRAWGKPTAVISLGYAFPLTFHGVWVPNGSAHQQAR